LKSINIIINHYCPSSYDTYTSTVLLVLQYDTTCYLLPPVLSEGPLFSAHFLNFANVLLVSCCTSTTCTIVITGERRVILDIYSVPYWRGTTYKTWYRTAAVSLSVWCVFFKTF